MCVCLGDVCVMLGSSLMFLVFLLCVDRRKVYHIYFITTKMRGRLPVGSSYPGHFGFKKGVSFCCIHIHSCGGA